MELDALFPVIVVMLVAAFGVALLLVLAFLMVTRVNSPRENTGLPPKE